MSDDPINLEPGETLDLTDPDNPTIEEPDGDTVDVDTENDDSSGSSGGGGSSPDPEPDNTNNINQKTKSQLSNIISSDAPPEKRRQARIELDERKLDDNNSSSRGSNKEDGGGGSNRDSNGVARLPNGDIARTAGEVAAAERNMTLEQFKNTEEYNDNNDVITVSGNPSEGDPIRARGKGETIEEARKDAAKNPRVDFAADTPVGKKERQLNTNQPLINPSQNRPEQVQQSLQQIANNQNIQNQELKQTAQTLSQKIQKKQDKINNNQFNTTTDDFKRTVRNNPATTEFQPRKQNENQENRGNQFEIPENFDADVPLENLTEKPDLNNDIQTVSASSVSTNKNDEETLEEQLLGDDLSKTINYAFTEGSDTPVIINQGTTFDRKGPTTEEIINENINDVETAFERNPGFTTAQKTEKTLEDVGISENAAEDFGNVAGLGTSIAADLAATTANPGKTFDGLVTAVTNPEKVVNAATSRDTNIAVTKNQEGEIVSAIPLRPEKQKFQEASAFGEALITVGSAGSTGVATKASKIRKLAVGNKADGTDLDAEQGFALNDNVKGVENVEGSDLTAGELVSTGVSRLGDEVRAVTGIGKNAKKRVGNFKDRSKEIAGNLDPSTGLGRNKKPGELTFSTAQKAKSKTSNILDFVKGDINSEINRKPEARNLVIDKNPEGVRFADQKTVENKIPDTTQLSEDASDVGIDPRGNIPVEEISRNRRDVLIDKIEGLSDDINDRLNTGPVGSGPGALLKKQDLEDKTPEFDGDELSGRRIDSQDRRTDVDSVSGRNLRDRDLSRNRRSEFNRPRPDSSLDDAIGLNSGIDNPEKPGLNIRNTQETGQDLNQERILGTDEKQDESQETQQESELTQVFGSQTQRKTEETVFERENRRKRENNRNRRRDRDTDFDLNFEENTEEPIRQTSGNKDTSQSFQFTPTLGGTLFGEVERVSQSQLENLNQQSFSGLGQRNIFIAEQENTDKDKELQKQLGL